MYGSWDRGILGCDGIANIIDVAYEFEFGAGRLMRWKWWYLEALGSIFQSGVRLDDLFRQCNIQRQQED